MLACKPSTPPDEIISIARRWEEAHNSRLFVLTGRTTMSRWLVDEVYKQRDRLRSTDTLDIVIDSNGGTIDAAYQLVTVFRNLCSKVRVFVPDWAKSSATFFCLGADEIWMSRTAELGPLDAQIPDPRDPDNRISALDEFKAVDYLRTMAFETMDETAQLLIKRTSMRMRDILSEARQFASNLMEPLNRQVDPLHIGAAHRALELSMEYGKRVMTRYVYKDWTDNETREFLERLTWKYPSHSFVIDFDEAKELGLNVFLLEGEQEEQCHAIINTMDECVGFLGVDFAPTESIPEEVTGDGVLPQGGSDESQ